MTVRAYYSTDTSAPVLSGTVGSLIAVLDACLVNGYGAKAGAGWSKPFSGTNLAAYQQGSGGSSHLLRVDDTNATAARVVGYETMSDVNTGVNPFPSSAQFSGGTYVVKSSAASSVARPWIIVATSNAFYLYVGDSDTTIASAGTGQRQIAFFGKFVSNKAGDAFNTALISGTTSGATGSYFGVLGSGLQNATAGHFIARSHTQIGQAITANKTSDSGVGTLSGAVTAASYPDPVSGGMLMSPVHINESSGVRRGKLPGLYALLHNLPGQCGDTFSGTGSLAGKSFILLNVANSSSAGRIALETSDTW